MLASSNISSLAPESVRPRLVLSHPGACLYLYLDGKRQTSIARTWDDIKCLLDGRERSTAQKADGGQIRTRYNESQWAGEGTGA